MSFPSVTLTHDIQHRECSSTEAAPASVEPQPGYIRQPHSDTASTFEWAQYRERQAACRAIWQRQSASRTQLMQSSVTTAVIPATPASIATRIAPELVPVATVPPSDLNPEAPVFAPEATPPAVSQRWKPKEKRRGVRGSLARAEKRLLNPEVRVRAEQYKAFLTLKPRRLGQ